MARTSKDDIQSVLFIKAAFAELIGTFLLVLVGCGSCSTINNVSASNTHIAFSFGLAVATIVWSVAHVSGGHINPAVSVAFFVTRKISLLRLGAYLAAQIVGGIAAAFLLTFLTPPGVNDSVCSPNLNDKVSVDKGLFIEFLITFVLVWTVFATCDTNRGKMSGSGPLAIGISVTICHFWAIPFTGAAMNPARALASHVASGTFKSSIWIYWVGPILGGIAAGLLYDLAFAGNSGITKLKNFIHKDYDDENFDKAGKSEDSFPS